ncbi:MAG: chemotaxis protein CheD [Desulfopila sp.]|jgi:chemotaxis protein CheD|nr:chemotaxis protein CheD [Desulfopila sp.]
MKNRDISLLENIYLKPGELIIMGEPAMVTTVLGSCVAVTMFHKPTGLAAICHAMQPSGHGSKSFRFVDTAVRYMINFFDKNKVSRKEIETKLFGGAEMFRSVQPKTRDLSVGWQNISMACHCLQNSGLILKNQDTGGQRGRKLVFTTDTGAVYLKRLHNHERIP